MKDKLISSSAELDLKLKSLNNYQRVNHNNYEINHFETDYSKLPFEIEEILLLADRFIEMFIFVENLYSLNSERKYFIKLPINIIRELTDLKFKEIIFNEKAILLKQWAEEYFEIAFSDNDYLKAGNKLDELSDNCPNIISKHDKELITVT